MYSRKLKYLCSYFRGIVFVLCICYTVPVYCFKYFKLKSLCWAPVHIVTGSAGCQEGRDHFRRNPFEWSAFRSQDYGYTRFKAYNKTHINMEQVSVDLKGEVIDKMWLIKNKQLRFTKI